MSYNFLKRSIILFLIIYAFAGFFFTRDNKEVYPFFSWDLFSRVPGETFEDFDLLIHKIGDKEFNPPVFFKQTEGLYDKRDTRIGNYHPLIINLALSVKDQNLDEIFRNRSILESKFLLHPVEYEVVTVKFNTIERFETGRILEIRGLDKFTSMQ